MTKTLLRVLMIAAVTCFTGNTYAQLINCNVYLQGAYMEVGINNNGAIGTSYDPPAGFHQNTTDTMYNDCTSFSFNVIQGLGFVVDPNMDGWGTGSPAYYGDFVMAHLPREGWAISDVGASSTAYAYHYASSSAGFTGPLSGSNTSFTTSGTLQQGMWSGVFNGTDTVVINQTATIDVNNLFMLVHIDFMNASVTPDTFYYMRAVNPQNESVCSSNDSTINIIEHQLPDPAGLVVVSATGLTYSSAYMALGTMDSRAKAFIIKDSTLPGYVPYANIWAGDTAHYKYSDTLTKDVGIGVIWQIILGPGAGTSLDYAYTFRGGLIDSLFDTTLSPLHAQNVVKAGVQVYPNPTNGVVNVTGITTGDHITVYDIMGRAVLQSDVTTGQTSQTISVSNVPAGLYIVAVKDLSGKTKARIPLRKE